VARIRLDIGDVTQNDGVRATGGNFSDEELLDFYTREGESQAAASARACETLSREWARMVDEQAGPIRHSYSQAAARWQALARDFRTVAGGGAALVSAGVFRRADGYAYRAGSVDVTQ
jgi:hypothetical protein